MLRRALLAAGLATLALPAAASAATISTNPTEVVYQAASGDLVEVLVIIGFDSDLNSQAIFFNPIGMNPTDPTTSDPNCVARTSGGSSCAVGVNRDRTRIQLAEQNDFVNVGGAGSVVEFHGGAGADRIFSTAGTRLEAFGDAGNDDLMGGTSVDTLDGGADNDLLTPRGSFDALTGGSGFDTANTDGGTTGVNVTLDNTANDGTPGENQNFKSDIEKVVGGAGNDQLEGNGLANTLSGADGADTLTGGGGPDTLEGGAANDLLQARDGVADVVDCGTGTGDTAQVDPVDVVNGNCETVQYADADNDGVNAKQDCNDQNAAIHPGATEVRGNGIDEDCSGADLPRLPPPTVDSDGDGVVRAQDCNDADAAIRPGAHDVPGNRIDEDCDGRDAPFPVISSPIKSSFTVFAHSTKVTRLVVRNVPPGASVKATCKGRDCPFRRRAAEVRNGKAKLTAPLRGKRLKPGAVLEVRITAPDMVGKVVRYKIRKRKLPRSSELCLPPGAARPGVCVTS